MALSLTGSLPTQAKTAPAPHSRRWWWGREDLKQCNHSNDIYIYIYTHIYIYIYNYFISVPTVKCTLITLKQELVDELSTWQL
jgi:hypothetical protein